MQIISLQECNTHGISNRANSFYMDAGLEADQAFVKELCSWAAMKPSAVAKVAGLAATTLLRAYNGEATTRISQPTIEKLQKAFPKFPKWPRGAPDLPTLPPSQDYVDVDVLPSFAGMGGGGTGEGDRLLAKLPRRLIEEELKGRPSDFELIDVRGDSMQPDFVHGDQILIDRRDRDPRQPGPFALWDEDGYVLKLVERVPGRRGWYRIFSANPRYSSYEIEETESTIRGRPVWFARRL